MIAPTRFPALNAVLAALVEGASGVLGAKLISVYLQGSFALGDGDEFSDVDFIAVTRDDLSQAEESALNTMHQALHSRPEVWAQHLEGSYAPASFLRRLSGSPRDIPSLPPDWVDPHVSGKPAPAYPFLYLNNGDRTLVRSAHGNTLVVRWILRQHGIALTGPPPRDLIDYISPDELRAEVRATMRSFGATLLDGTTPIDALWLQGFTVLAFARMLYTLESATIVSKPAAVAWAKSKLDPVWSPLLDRAWSQRARYPRGQGAPAAHAALRPDPSEVALTLDFVRFALAQAPTNQPPSKPRL